MQDGSVETGFADHECEVLHEWLEALQKRFNSQPVSIVLETGSVPLIAALREYHWIRIYAICPLASALKAPLAEQGKDFRLIKRPTWIPEPNNPQDHRIQPFYENLSASPLARYAVITKRISGAKSDTLLAAFLSSI